MSLDLSGLNGLLAGLAPEQQTYAKREIARHFKRRFISRLKKQTDVNGRRFQRRVKRNENRKMLQGFTQSKRLNVRYHKAGFFIGYRGGFAERARIHNLGLHDRIRNRLGEQQSVHYPARQWVGVNLDDKNAILKILARYYGK